MIEIKPPLRILILEDNPFDMILMKELVQHEMQEAEFYCATNEETYLRALDVFVPDIVLSDNCFPKFTAAEALGILRKRSLDIPFILVTGSLSEDLAIALVEQGANDYILKDRMTRLPLAIETALKQQQADKEIADYRHALNLAAIVVLTDRNGFITGVNENYCNLSGYGAAEITGNNQRIQHPCFQQGECLEAIQSGATWRGEFLQFAKNGDSYWLDTIVIPFVDKRNQPLKYMAVSNNITEKKKLQAAVQQQQNSEQLKIKGIAREAERHVIGRELHADVNQLLVATKLLLSEIIMSTGRDDEPLQLCSRRIDNAIEQNRKITGVLVSTDIETATLQEQLKILVDSMLTNGGVKTVIDTSALDEALLSKLQKISLYCVAQEQCTNIIKHAAARHVFINLVTVGTIVKMNIKDDGVGVNTNEKKTGTGLKNITSRIGICNGIVRIVSSPGCGFTLEIEIPVNSQLLSTTPKE